MAAHLVVGCAFCDGHFAHAPKADLDKADSKRVDETITAPDGPEEFQKVCAALSEIRDLEIDGTATTITNNRHERIARQLAADLEAIVETFTDYDSTAPLPPKRPDGRAWTKPTSVEHADTAIARIRHMVHLLAGKGDEDCRHCVCTCHHTCGKDSHSGDWHQHENDPCPVHPDAPMVG